MGRYPKKKDVVENIKENVSETESLVQQAPDETIKRQREAEFIQSEKARLDSEKSSKDALIMNSKQLTQHILDQKKELQNVNVEIENKYLVLKNLDNEIKSQNYNVSRLKEKFEKDNAEQVRVMGVKQKEIELADAEYKKLTIEVNSMKNRLSNELKAIQDERIAMANEISRLNIHVSQVESESSRSKADIAEREQKLKDALIELEAEKESIKPEFARISAIKNENMLLFKKIDEAQAHIKRQEDNIEAYKQKLDADAEAGKQAIARERLAFQNTEARLRKWEQDLNDQALELSAREISVAQDKKRYQLHQVVESNKE